MKKLILLLLTFLFIAGYSLSFAEVQPCYWQLTAIETDSSQKTFNGQASSSTSIDAATETDPIKMMGIVSGTQSVRLELHTVRNLSSISPTEPQDACGVYTISGIPVIVPGNASAQLTVTANTVADRYSFYLYANLIANRKQVMRVRNTGSWVIRTHFPGEANPGDTYRISLKAHEGNDVAAQSLSYIYTAVPGYTLIDPAGNTILYDAGGRETDRLSKTLKENLPNLISEVKGTDGVIFSSEQQDDGSIVALFSPENGLSTEEILEILHALQENVERTDRPDQAGMSAPSSAGSSTDNPEPASSEVQNEDQKSASEPSGLNPDGSRKDAMNTSANGIPAAGQSDSAFLNSGNSPADSSSAGSTGTEAAQSKSHLPAASSGTDSRGSPVSQSGPYTASTLAIPETPAGFAGSASDNSSQSPGTAAASGPSASGNPSPKSNAMRHASGANVPDCTDTGTSVPETANTNNSTESKDFIMNTTNQTNTSSETIAPPAVQTQAGGILRPSDAALQMPVLSSDSSAATLWLSKGSDLSDEVLTNLIEAACGRKVDFAALSKDIQAGKITISTEPTPAPVAMSLASAMESAQQFADSAQSQTAVPEATPAVSENAPTVQAAAILGEDRVEAIALAPSAQTDSKTLTRILSLLSDARENQATYNTIFGSNASANQGLIEGDDGRLSYTPSEKGAASVSVSALDGSNRILEITQGDASALLRGLESLVVELKATP
ncbi:MAG: hypothetical protein IJT77_01965, partial [Clostridia bacterium]|nr:hypothetical protein [Clostridia bacterium]